MIGWGLVKIARDFFVLREREEKEKENLKILNKALLLVSQSKNVV